MISYVLPKSASLRFIILNLAYGAGHVLVLSNVGGYTIAVPYAAGGLGGVNPSFATWATTDYLAGLALGYPIALWLEGQFEPKIIIVISYILFASLSFICAISQDIFFYVPVRIIQGIVGGISLPIGQRLFLNEYPQQQRRVGLSVWGVFTIMPFTIGIPIGGWISEFMGWQYIFLANIPISTLIAFLISNDPIDSKFIHHNKKFDVIGFILFSAFIIGLQTILNQGNDFDWFDSSFLTLIAIVVIITLPILLIWELGEDNPAINIRNFSYRNYAIASLLTIIGFSILQGLIVALFGGQLQLLLGYSSSLAGWIYLILFPLSLPLVALIHYLCEDVDARFLISMNFIGLSVVLTWLGLFDQPSDFDQILWPMIFVGFCLGAFYAPLGILGMHGMPNSLIAHATEQLALLRTISGGLGIAIQGVIHFRRLPFHQLDLADHLGGRRYTSYDTVGQLVEKLTQLHFPANATNALLWQLIRSRSSLLAFNDAFLMSAFICIIMAALVWLAEETKFKFTTKEISSSEDSALNKAVSI